MQVIDIIFSLVCAVALFFHFTSLRENEINLAVYRYMGKNGEGQLVGEILVRNEMARSLKMLVLFAVGIGALLKVPDVGYLIILVPIISLVASVADYLVRKSMIENAIKIATTQHEIEVAKRMPHAAHGPEAPDESEKLA